MLFVTWIDEDGLEHELPAIIEACAACRGTGRLTFMEEDDTICLICAGRGRVTMVAMELLPPKLREAYEFDSSSQESERRDWRDRM